MIEVGSCMLAAGTVLSSLPWLMKKRKNKRADPLKTGLSGGMRGLGLSVSTSEYNCSVPTRSLNLIRDFV